jgi:hypothetical protein
MLAEIGRRNEMRSQRSQTALLLFVILILIVAIWLVYWYFLRPVSVAVPAPDQSQTWQYSPLRLSNFS